MKWPEMILRAAITAVSFAVLSFLSLPFFGCMGPFFLSICLIYAVKAQCPPEIPRDHCKQCGYNLTGNVSGTCPECGTAVEASGKKGMRQAGRIRPVLKWAGVAILLFILATLAVSQLPRLMEGIEPVHVMSEGRPLGELTAVSVDISIPESLQAIGIKEGDIRRSVEARLKEAGLRILPPNSSSCPEVCLGVSLDPEATKEVLLSGRARLVKGSTGFLVLYQDGKSYSQEWMKSCRFASRPTNLPRTAREGLDRLLSAFLDDYRGDTHRARVPNAATTSAPAA